MLNYLTNNITELFKKVHLSVKDNNEISESDVVKVLDVTKSGGVISEKEIWPNAPTRLHLTTNYDNANVNKEQLPNSAYTGPVLVPSNKDYINNPLAITVVPYPPDAKWKLEHSNNIEDAAIFHQSFYGTQTINIPLNDALEEDVSEYRWIQAVSAIEGHQIEPAKFRFFVKHPSTENSLDVSPPNYQWTFDTDTPYFDIQSNKELTNYRNLSPAEDHIVPEFDSNNQSSGCDKQGLRAVYYVDDRICIYVNGIVYIRNISLDNTEAEYAKYGWNNTIEGSVFTTSTTPTIGDQVYDDTDAVIENAIVDDYFTVQNNKWYCDLGVDVPVEDSDFTVAAYVKYKRGGYIGFIKPSESTNYISSIGIEWSYYTFTLLGSNDARTYNKFDQSHYPALSRPTKNDEGWTHCAVSCSKQMNVNECSYDPSLGYGFIISRCIFVVKKSGNTWQNINEPFVRDPSKDQNGKYAFTWIQAGLSAQESTYPDLGIAYDGTIWTEFESPASWSAFYVDPTGNTLDKNVYQMRNTVYRLTYQDDRYPDEYGQPYIETWDNNKFGQSGEGSDPTTYKIYARMMVGWVAGEMIGKYIYKYSKSSTSMNTQFGVYLMPDNQNTIVGSTTYDGVDDICVYKRMYTDQEAANAAKKLGIVVDTTTKPKLAASYRNRYDPVKITINESEYLYDPNKTVYYSEEIPEEPGTYRELEIRYGWEKISGDGPDTVWTVVLTPAVNSKCYNDSEATTLDENLVISDVVNIGTNETPLTGNILQPYIIDDRTIAIVIVTHEYIYKKLRTLFPDFEAVSYNSENGYIKDYVLGYTVNCCIWETQQAYQPYINIEADKEENWKVDNTSVIIRDRWYTCGGLFRYYQPQYRNCKPYNSMYASHSYWNYNGICGDYNQVVYITLPEPMTEGSTHEVTWCGNKCTFDYSSEHYAATIKVNQEGYLPWIGKRYAYMGRWLGGTPYDPVKFTKTSDTVVNLSKEYYTYDMRRYTKVASPVTSDIANYYERSLITDLVFYVVPSKNPDIAHSIFQGPMTLRSIFASNTGICSDRYALGNETKNKPINGENTYELDFSNIESCVKSAIIVNDVKYFRDELEDWTDGYIIVDGVTYYRETNRDTCNAYAWFNQNNDKVLYTDTHIPTTSELAREGYDDFDNTHQITNVNSYKLYGWTTERITEDDWGTCTTVWTRSEYPVISDIVEQVDGSTSYVSEYLTNQVTRDISGEYQIYIPHIGWSHKFLISNQAVGHMFYIHSRGMFHERSGCYDVKHPYTNWEYPGPAHEITFDGGFIHDEGQAKDASVAWQVDPVTHEPILTISKAKIAMSSGGTAFSINTDQNKVKSTPLYDVHGGWFDAADFDMRIMHMAIFGEYANAYIRFPDNFTDNQLDLPESGDGVPDILSEALWGAELYRKGQLENGAVRAWFETHRHENGWPWESDYKYYACAPSMRNSVRYAIHAARLARALRIASTKVTNPAGIKKCKEYANLYTESACAAFEYGTKDLMEPYIKLPDSERTPVYITCKGNTYAWLEWITCFNNDDVTANLKEYGLFVFMAACSLYCLTKESRFAKYIDNNIAQKYCNTMRTDVNEYGRKVAWEPAVDEIIAEDFPDVYNTCKDFYTGIADTWINSQEKNTYRMLQWKPGENNFQHVGYGVGHPDCRGAILLLSYVATKNTKYRDALMLAMDNVTGCNNLGRCWTTGLGKISPARHLDHWMPLNILRNDIWTPRPGISLYYFFEPYRLLWTATLIAMHLKFEGRDDQNCPPISIDVMPSLLAQRYYAVTNNARAILGFPVIPFFSQEPLYDVEEINVGPSEYTIWETIARKVVFTGCLMGKGFKPKFYYKQIAPKKTFRASIEHFATLP